MKRAFCFLLVLPFALLAAIAYAQPKMEIQQSVFDAGTMYRSKTKIEHAFVIKNNGTADLKILSARPGCGCTITKFDDVIAPGAEGKVYASVDVSHFNGPIDKPVDLETNDPAQPNARLSIKANIKTYFDVRPSEQVRFTVSKGKLESKEVLITPTYEKPVKLMAPTVSNSQAFDAKLDPPEAGSTEYKLVVSLKDTARVGNQSAVITIPVEGNVIPAQEISVVAVIRGPIAANPSLVSFQVKTFPDEIAPTGEANIYQQPDEKTTLVTRSEAGQPLRVIAQKEQWYQVITGDDPSKRPEQPGQTRVSRVGWVKKDTIKTVRESTPPEAQTITFRKTRGNFKVLEFLSTMPDVKLEMQPTEGEANMFTLKATLTNPGQVKKNTPPGAIVVKTDDPDQPEVRVPLYVIVS